MRKPIICLMGPTAAGKTQLAVQLVEQFPLEIISVDSAMVYRYLDIGTAKPNASILKRAPHRLINLIEPTEIYSAGQFRTDALREIADVVAHNKIPLLVGGSMLYFHILEKGLAILPTACEPVRVSIQQQAKKEGWAHLHAKLANIDSMAASRIHPHDSQRIQRALEVYLLTGKSITTWQSENTNALPSDYTMHHLAIVPENRAALHERIFVRFQKMLQEGFVAEVGYLYGRGDLSPDLPILKSVGYRQIWDYLEGKLTEQQMHEQAVAATRQLAKRQMTWLRSFPDVCLFDSGSMDVSEAVGAAVSKIIERYVF